jgi:MoaA/NifB/PqqE/SkfB family radical SAM enzyme
VSKPLNINQEAHAKVERNPHSLLLNDRTIEFHSEMRILKGWERKWVDLKAGLHIFMLAIKNYGSLSKSIRVIKTLYHLKKSILGGIQTKIVKLEGKYYHYLYAPCYPSKAFDKYIEGEFHRILPLKKKTNNLTFIIFAITKKCPLQCEHCLEWQNLNKTESFNLKELKAVISKFQNDGIAQFHLSGGEPMVRVKDLEQVIRQEEKQSEFYVLTSGFNFTSDNARKLKQAGLTGVVISLDHFDPEMHNAFRGFNTSFNDVLNAIQNAHEQKLVVALSICVTRSFTNWDNLMHYAKLAKKLNVAFIQLLEPKAVGHYEGKDVHLNKDHLDLLNKFYFTMNFDPAYADFPIIAYHGYHQRTVGCFSGGNRMLYIDSEGYINACPFCHTKDWNIKDAIKTDLNIPAQIEQIACPRFTTASQKNHE